MYSILISCIWLFHQYLALRISEAERPLEIFHKWAVSPMIPLILHSFRIDQTMYVRQLSRLLRHSRLPYDNFYEEGCKEYMDRKRLDMVASFGESVLLSPKCLSKITWNLSSIPLEFLNVDNLLSSPSTPLAPSLPLGKVLRSFKGDLMQQFDWLTDTRLYRTFFRKSAAARFEREDAWKFFHHSSFTSEKAEGVLSHFDRSHQLILWLLDEFSLEDLSKLEKSKIMRWIVHLLLVRDSLKSTYTSSRESFPFKELNDYLVKAEQKFRSSSPSLKSLIKRALFHGSTIPCFTVIHALVTENTECPKIRARWSLSVLELYLHISHDPEFWVSNEVYETLSMSLQNATVLEQLHWIKLLKRFSGKLQWLEPWIEMIIQESKELQNELLEMPLEPSIKDLINRAIPFDRRLKHARKLFFTGKSQSASKLLEIFRQTHRTKLHAIRVDMNKAILAFYSGLGRVLYFNSHQQFSVAMLSTTRLSELAFIQATSLLFDIKSCVVIDERQMDIVFGVTPFNGWQSCFAMVETAKKSVVPLSECQVLEYSKPYFYSENLPKYVVFNDDIHNRLKHAVGTVRSVFGPLLDDIRHSKSF